MPPKKARHSEPIPPPQPKKPRQSLPAKPRLTTPKPAAKRRKLESTLSEDEYSPTAAPPRGKSRTSTSANVRKNKVTIEEEEEEDDEVMDEEEEDEEVEEKVEKLPVKRGRKSAVKDIAQAAAAKKSSARLNKSKTELSKGQAKLAEIFSVGRASLDTSEGESGQPMSDLWDRLINQTSIKTDQITALRKGSSDRFDGVNALATPLITILEARAQLRASILSHIRTYEKQPNLMRAILQKIDTVQMAAIEAGRRHMSTYQNDKQMIRGGSKWIGWNRTTTR